MLIVGDSIGLDLGGPLQSDLAGTGVVNAALDARESTGLTRPDYFNWPAELTSDIAEVHPQVVVMMIGGNDAQDFPGPPDVPYTRRSGTRSTPSGWTQFMQIAASGGATVVWVGMPPYGEPVLNAQMQDLNAVVQQQAAATVPPVVFLSTDKTLGTPQGGYTAFVTNAAGQVINVRAPDGTHLTVGRRIGGGRPGDRQLRAMGYRIAMSPRRRVAGSDEGPGVGGPVPVVDQLGQRALAAAASPAVSRVASASSASRRVSSAGGQAVTGQPGQVLVHRLLEGSTPPKSQMTVRSLSSRLKHRPLSMAHKPVFGQVARGRSCGRRCWPPRRTRTAA